ncbi:MAG: hypothetical protein Q8J68_09395 [Methanolobus sp.]|uniref:hypothetical protein n=1 Tax=Methanolobus sp. TaxID=1874737 RepID=UPI00273116C4|nr:hypothetical protein [Methanolobus sp.]MDP2217487.1 hypothetical protein [Methanolobus sp.]
MQKRKTEVKAFSMDKITQDNLEYILGSHYCNQLGCSALISAMINEKAAELRFVEKIQAMGQEISIPQGWFGGSAGTVSVMR